ncbi:hypothetical protein HJ588_18690 [Flexivirga sp. ID2601S]|uniref:N-acetyltransferase domain-containing protein n=1 Tax=Flexivirga aerilata TaxID=1656889 RepID=A0A849APF0_9MICO|nr:GNAT family N-acetyltransferase [Flexivirga aerilata]NNG41291.1 hypothetical protein [Flexivirga aerilata]
MPPTLSMPLAMTSCVVPPSAPRLVTDDFTMVRFDTGYRYDAGVFDIRGEREPRELIRDVVAQARAWGRTAVWWHGLTDTSAPRGLEDALLAAGAQVADQHAVFAVELDRATTPDGLDPAIEVHEPGDDAEVRMLRTVDQDSWEVHRSQPDDLDIARRHAQGTDRFETHLLAMVDGRPAGSATLTTRDDLAVLWGGATAGWARGRGVYRALTRDRLGRAQGAGCRIAIAKAQPQLADVLGDFGFVSCGNERTLRMTIGA